MIIFSLLMKLVLQDELLSFPTFYKVYGCYEVFTPITLTYFILQIILESDSLNTHH